MLRRPLRAAVLLVVAVTLTVGGVVVLARGLGWQAGPLLFAVSLTPYVGLGCLLAAVVAAVLRSWVLAAIGLLLFGVVAWWWVPAFVPAPASGPPLDLRVMSVNLRYGEADPGAVVERVRTERADLLSLQELTPQAVRQLEATGLRELLPHREVRTGPGATGTGIWSRYPLTQPFETDDLGFENVGATVQRPGGALVFFGVHPVAPKPLDGTAREATLYPLLQLIERQQGPVIVAGDFNATRDNVAMRQLAAAGYVDAADAAGAGWIRTWPNDLRPLPPLVAIDHVIARELPPGRSVRAFEIPGSDHYGVVAQF